MTNTATMTGAAVALTRQATSKAKSAATKHTPRPSAPMPGYIARATRPVSCSSWATRLATSHGLIVSAAVTTADGYAKREAGKAMIADARHAADDQAQITLGADKGYDAQEFIEALIRINCKSVFPRGFTLFYSLRMLLTIFLVILYKLKINMAIFLIHLKHFNGPCTESVHQSGMTSRKLLFSMQVGDQYMNQDIVMGPRLAVAAPMNHGKVIGNFDTPTVMGPRLAVRLPMNLAKVIGNFDTPTVMGPRLAVRLPMNLAKVIGAF
jgi:hypothetical protein